MEIISVQPMLREEIQAQSALKQRVFRHMYRGHVSDERIDRWLARSSSVEALTARLDDPNRVLFTACLGDEIIGGAIGQDKGTAGYLSAVWVREDQRRCGVGEMLCDARERELIARGCGLLQLHVWRENTAAHLFATQRGYLFTGDTRYDELTDSQLDLYERVV